MNILGTDKKEDEVKTDAEAPVADAPATDAPEKEEEKKADAPKGVKLPPTFSKNEGKSSEKFHEEDKTNASKFMVGDEITVADCPFVVKEVKGLELILKRTDII